RGTVASTGDPHLASWSRPAVSNRGIGEALLWHALTVAESAALLLGVRVVVAHAVGERATGFCSRFGFRPFESDPERLYLLTQDISASPHACCPVERVPSHFGRIHAERPPSRHFGTLGLTTP